MLNRSAVVVKPKQPFLDWLHHADPTSRGITLEQVGRTPRIYLLPECDTEDDLREVLEELCEEIFVDQLDGGFREERTWPTDRSYEAFYHWFDVRSHSVLIDLCDEPLIDDAE